jgi:hypothetical protein
MPKLSTELANPLENIACTLKIKITYQKLVIIKVVPLISINIFFQKYSIGFQS